MPFVFIRLLIFYLLLVVQTQVYASVLILDSSYFDKDPSPASVKSFILSWLGAQSYLFDSLSFTYLKEHPWAHLSAGLGMSLYLQQFVGDIVYHEFAHQIRFKSLGIKSQYENKETHFFSYFLYRLSQLRSGGSVSALSHENTGQCLRIFAPHEKIRPYLDASSLCLNALGGLWMSSAGLNYQMNLASELGKKVHLGQGHIYEWFTHLTNRYSIGFYYSLFDSIHENSSQRGNDVKNIVSQFKKLGIPISHEDLKISSLLSLILSSSTWAYFASVHRFLITGDSRVSAPILYGFWLPDVETYLSSSGLSYRISTGYQLSKERHLPLYFEFIGKGRFASELSFGYFGKLTGSWWAELLLNVSNRVDGRLEVLKNFGKGLYLGVGIEHKNIENFFGERYIGSLQKRSFETNNWIRLKWQMKPTPLGLNL